MQSKITAIKEILEKREDEWGELLGYLPDCSGTIEAEHDKFRLETAKQIHDLYKPPGDLVEDIAEIICKGDTDFDREGGFTPAWDEALEQAYQIALKARLYYEGRNDESTVNSGV